MVALLDPHFQALDANGLPLAGAKLYFYEAGTTTPITIYQDADGATPHANPVIADSSGLFAAIFVTINEAMKFVLKTAGDVTVQTIDDVTVVGPPDYTEQLDATGGLIVSGNIEGDVGSVSSSFEVQSSTDAGMSLYRKGAANTSDEVYIAGFARDAANNLRKTFSISEQWRDTSGTDGYSSLRLNATYRAAGVGLDDLSVQLFGGKGVTLNGDTITDSPHLVDSGVCKTLVRYGLTSYTNASGTAIALAARNLNNGATTKCRFRMGNNLSSEVFTIDVNSSPHTDSNATHLVNRANAAIYLGTNDIEKQVTVGVGGFLSVNKLTSSASEVKRGVALAPTGYIVSAMNGSGADTHMFIVREADGTPATVGSISSSGTTTAFNTTSDQRLKENFSDFDAGRIIDQISVYQYEWKMDGSRGFGPKAQELAEAFPIAVTPGNDLEPGQSGFVPWVYDPSKLVPLLLREIQSLRQRLDAAGL